MIYICKFTVVSTKARTVESKLGDNYLLIGPDIQREGDNPEFEEDDELLKAWRQSVYNDGIRIRIGRWRVVGRPIAVLVDYTSLFPKKDDILKFLWETYHVDSISGQRTTSSRCSSATRPDRSSPPTWRTSAPRRTRWWPTSTSG